MLVLLFQLVSPFELGDAISPGNKPLSWCCAGSSAPKSGMGDESMTKIKKGAWMLSCDARDLSIHLRPHPLISVPAGTLCAIVNFS